MTAPAALTHTLDLIGNTPLVLLKGPSEEAGCEIWGKCEFANTGFNVCRIRKPAEGFIPVLLRLP